MASVETTAVPEMSFAKPAAKVSPPMTESTAGGPASPKAAATNMAVTPWTQRTTVRLVVMSCHEKEHAVISVC